MEGNNFIQPLIFDIGYNPPERSKVLVVDDETNLQSLVFDIIGDDFRTISAYNGREAIEKAGTFLPEVILMDIMMADMGGYEAVQLLRDNEKTRHIPVIVMSAMDFDSSTIEMFNREPNVKGFLTKPFSNRQLVELIHQALPSSNSK